jgi:hypothetical protein
MELGRPTFRGRGSSGALRNMWDLKASKLVEYASSSILSGFVPSERCTHS